MNINCIDSEWNKPHIPGFFQRILPFPLPSQSDPSPHFSVTFDNSSVLRRGALGSAVTLNPLILHRGSSAQERASKWNYGDAFGGLTRMYEIPPEFSPTLMNCTCLASHLPRCSLCNVSHAWRSVCTYACLCGCIYIQPGIEGAVTHSHCSLFLPHILPTHPPPIS